MSKAINNLANTLTKTSVAQEIYVGEMAAKRSADAVTVLNSFNLSRPDYFKAVDLFEANPGLANIFLAMPNDDTRKEYIEAKIHGGGSA